MSVRGTYIWDIVFFSVFFFFVSFRFESVRAPLGARTPTRAFLSPGDERDTKQRVRAMIITVLVQGKCTTWSYLERGDA